MKAFLRDARHSFRLFFKSPGFTITAVAALALAIGATTAIFSIVNTVLLKPLPIADAGRLVALVSTSVDGNGERGEESGYLAFCRCFGNTDGEKRRLLCRAAFGIRRIQVFQPVFNSLWKLVPHGLKAKEHPLDFAPDI